MDEARPPATKLRRPIAFALAGAALMPASCLAMVALVEGSGDVDVDDASFDRFIGIATAIGGVMEASFLMSCWAAFVVVSRLLHARSTRTRRVAATVFTIAWFAGLVAVQFAMLGSLLD